MNIPKSKKEINRNIRLRKEFGLYLYEKMLRELRIQGSVNYVKTPLQARILNEFKVRGLADYDAIINDVYVNVHLLDKGKEYVKIMKL